MWEGSLWPLIIELLWLNETPGPVLLQVWMFVWFLQNKYKTACLHTEKCLLHICIHWATLSFLTLKLLRHALRGQALNEMMRRKRYTRLERDRERAPSTPEIATDNIRLLYPWLSSLCPGCLLGSSLYHTQNFSCFFTLATQVKSIKHLVCTKQILKLHQLPRDYNSTAV